MPHLTPKLKALTGASDGASAGASVPKGWKLPKIVWKVGTDCADEYSSSFWFLDLRKPQSSNLVAAAEFSLFYGYPTAAVMWCIKPDATTTTSDIRELKNKITECYLKREYPSFKMPNIEVGGLF